MIKFSIITVCYNEPRLEDTCKTILNQTLQDFEWIVIDGGSDQKTLDIFEKYKNRIDYFVSEKDKGVYNAMNKGIREAHGEYLIFMNAGDCFYEPQTLEKVSKFIENKHADIFYGNGYMRKGNKICLHEIPQQLSKDFLYCASLFHQAVFYHKDVFQKYGYYDEKYKIASDWKHYLKVFFAGARFEYIPLNIAVDDDGGVSSLSYQLSQKERRQILEEVIGKEGAYTVAKKLWEDKKRFPDIIDLMKNKRMSLKKSSTNTPKISVIIPVYNAHDYLARCLDSICNQTLKDIEIIAVDDCSTDDSVEILQKYAAKYPQLKVIAHKENGGESRARNTGLDAATGEYLAFVDNDDTVDPDFYEKLYNKAVETGADIVKAEAHIFETNGTEWYDGLNNQIRSYNSKLFFSSYWWTAIYKSRLIKGNNIKLLEGYPLGGDVLFLNEAILKCNKLELVDGVYYNYYRRDDSGDSKILSDTKIHSAIDIFFMIADNIISSGLNKTRGVCFNLTAWLVHMLFYYPFHVKEVSTVRYILEKACLYYQKTKDYIDETYPNILPVVLDILKQNSSKELVEFYLKNESREKMFIANLRYLHNKRCSDA